MFDVTELRNEVFTSKYLTSVVGLEPNCTDENFIIAIAHLECELHLIDKLYAIIF